MRVRSYSLLAFFVAALFFISCGGKEEKKEKKSKEPKVEVVLLQDLSCDFETVVGEGDKAEFSSGEYSFGGAKAQSTDYAKSGSHSLELNNNFKYGAQYDIKGLKKGNVVEVSFWKKSAEHFGVGIVEFDDKNKLRVERVLQSKDGWDLVMRRVQLEENRDELKIFLVCMKDESVFFDDLSIKVYSSYPEPKKVKDAIEITIAADQWMKLENKRAAALEKGVLLSESDDYVKAKFKYKGEKAKIQMRLKGDWLDHLKSPKWSFRIKMKGTASINGMRVFSLQAPENRGFLREWYAHMVMEEEDILNTAYEFVPVYINGEYKGVYALEEHFEKQIVERRKRREGPIVRFEEDALFELHARYLETGNYPSTAGMFEAAVITPFRESKTLGSEGLSAQYDQARNLLFQHQMNTTALSDIYDVERIAKLLAIYDVMGIKHAHTWHNMRFYFNPVIARLEPIGFDCYSDRKEIVAEQSNAQMHMTDRSDNTGGFTDLFYEDEAIMEAYKRYAAEYSSEEFQKSVAKKLEKQLKEYEELLAGDYTGFEYDKDFYQAALISVKNSLATLTLERKPFSGKGLLPVKWDECDIHDPVPTRALKAYAQDTAKGRVMLRNYHCDNLEILGFGSDVSVIEAYNKVLEPIYANGKSITVDTKQEYVFYRAEGRTKEYKMKVFPKPYPNGKTVRQEWQKKNSVGKPFVIEGDKVILKAGKHALSSDVHVPVGKELYFEAGAQLDMKNFALISFGRVEMKGTEASPIVVFGDDPSGFTVIQAKGRSLMEHVRFENMNTLRIKGWTLTGAVTFYESDVDIRNCRFTGNDCEDGLNLVRCDFIVQDSELDDTYSDGFDADYCTGKVLRSSFHDTGNDCIDFSTSEILIEDCDIYNSGDKGISGGENSTLEIKNVRVRDSRIGVASKDLSHLDIDGIDIENCNYGYTIYQKKPEFGPATVNAKNSNVQAVDTLHMIEKNSLLELNGEKIEGDIEVDLEVFYGI